MELHLALRYLHLLTILLCAMFSATASAEPMQFRLAGNGGNCNGCEWLMAQGEISSDTPEAFRRYIEENGPVYRVMLHSPGGNLVAGIELGKLIREQKATTLIGKTVQMTGEGLERFETSEPGICASACAFAFMGGVERFVGPQDLLGVHQFYTNDNQAVDSSIVQMIAGMSLLHSIEMGIDPRVIVAASGTPPEDIYWFTESDLANLELDTSRQTTEPWKLEPYRDGLVLTTVHRASSRRSVAITLFCRSDDQLMRLLITEQFSQSGNLADGSLLLDFNGSFPLRPVLTIGESQFQVNQRNVESERVANGNLLVSLYLPSEITNYGNLRLAFDPDLARVFGPLLSFSIDLPGSEWFRALTRSCI